MKHACLSIVAASVAVLSAFAEREYIWPDGKMPDPQSHQVAAMANEKEKEMEGSELIDTVALIQVRQAKLGRTNSGRSYIVKKSTYD